ncbi:ribosomal protein L13e [Candidatus Bathyarchaeota archaeon]|nr:ribosomal protein L13e [Candidatus Bathyarchaeota archaeon]
MITIKPKIIKKDGKQRYGKGFSREELKKAGLSLKEAKKLSIPVDSRRKTAYNENTNVVKKFLRSKKKASEPEKRKKPKS